jgi:UDP:flavonoid glycosyltransferase YjiC (YdhE family)
MARILIPCTPLLGHLQPALVAGRTFRSYGHDVDVLTAADCEPLVREHNLGFRPLPAAAMGRSAGRLNTIGLMVPWVQARREVIARFVDPLIGQADALSDALGAVDYDVVLADTAYLGVLPLLVGPRAAMRPAVVGLGATPISAVSIDAAPFGSGLRNADTRFARQRNRQVNWLLHRGPLRPIHDALDSALAEFGVPGGTVDFFSLLGHFDLVVQLSLPELEYPRRELPATVLCTGPLPVPASPRWTPPAWWHRLDQSEGVIHVTQGTVDNADPQRLIMPAVVALRGSGRQIVVTTGRTTSGAIRHALDQLRSERVHVADFVPYDALLPRTDLMITNGGWGGVQQAARHGVPVIVAGRTEEKAEVGARVAWSGLGLDLRTGTPSPARIRSAVDAVLATDRYRDRAAEIAAAARRRPDPLAGLVSAVEDLIPMRPGQASDHPPVRDLAGWAEISI